MNIQRLIHVRYRVAGHARFEVPDALRQPAAAQTIEEELRQVEGVYRVDFYPRQGKLSVRYIEASGDDFKRIAKALHGIVAHIENAPACCAAARSISPSETAAPVSSAKNWVQGKYQEFKETLTALRLAVGGARRGKPVLSKEKERYVTEFFTDALVLYLIKMHWHMILNNWLRRPWQYRYEWLSTFYLIYLLVRSKMPKP
jgi:hypothetical protein